MPRALLMATVAAILCSCARAVPPVAPQQAAEADRPGHILRLVNDILGFIDPDQPLPRTGLSGMSAVMRAATDRAVVELAGETMASFEAARSRIRPMADDSKPIERDVLLRLEAIRPVVLAHRAFREVADRGVEFGLDPAPARAFLSEFGRRHLKLLQDWDYAYGDYHPYLHAFIMEVIDDDFRFHIDAARFADLDDDTLKTTDIDAARDFRGQPAVITAVQTLQARTWAHLFTWYRDLGREVDPSFYRLGLERWKALRQRMLADPGLRLEHPDHDRAVEVARMHIAVARLMVASGDLPAALRVLREVAEAREQPLAPHARAWIRSLTP